MAKVKERPRTESGAGYDEDFNRWIGQQVELLSAGRFQDLDIANLVEELDSMGKRDRRELETRLALVVQHLLKLQFQPEKATASWRITIREQRSAAAMILEDSPSLGRVVAGRLALTYRRARDNAAGETGLPTGAFPADCPYSLEEILDPAFLPA